jgi:hypothetical protein
MLALLDTRWRRANDLVGNSAIGLGQPDQACFRRRDGSPARPCTLHGVGRHKASIDHMYVEIHVSILRQNSEKIGESCAQT